MRTMAMPFSIMIPKGLQFEDSIKLKGKIKGDAKKFDFHICFRFNCN